MPGTASAPARTVSVRRWPSYTGDRPVTIGSDFALLAGLVACTELPVIDEAGSTTPSPTPRDRRPVPTRLSFGTAITHPTRITKTYEDRV